ncbi:5-formyltetrahydrofolate cyclo-ligase [Blastopirellula marina]|uniref:5-formyltetrahydrofolate cyclo-ligase n=1 Tax=Blastopirellula marina DSM 3645 TaxID=314230 RepID=A4A119_9BACT|nr:5-formyltetrahydrofolate cyclo-ligase [Blastopirellula marina]EAQ77586.1 5-formyltetrahydrofolate cyclo-ligase [Blastopirellula marina DSM 3645]
MAQDALQQKKTLRQSFLAARNQLGDRSERSVRIQARISNWLPQQSAATLLCYVNARCEVDTRSLLHQLLADERRVVVPYCLDDNHLGLFLLSNMSELATGRFGILEPRHQLRDSKRISPVEIDLAILPGVAFDLHGNRLGYGKGYFDRLLSEMRPQAVTCALAFECQLTAQIPTEPHDLPIDYLVTEDRLIRSAAAN